MSNQSGLSSVAVGVITLTFAVTCFVSVTITVMITFVVTYLCVKRTLGKANKTANLTDQSPGPQETLLYEQVSVPSHTVIKNDLELQANPAYGTIHKVVMDTNPAYESCK